MFEVFAQAVTMKVPVAMFGVGPLELFIFSVIVLLLFGNRLPSVMRSLGRGIVEFKKGVQGIEDETDKPAKEAKESKPPESDKD